MILMAVVVGTVIITIVVVVLCVGIICHCKKNAKKYPITTPKGVLANSSVGVSFRQQTFGVPNIALSLMK